MKTITLSDVSLKTVSRAIAQLETSQKGIKERALTIAASILAGADQSGETERNAYYQRAGALVNAVKANQSLVKELISFFDGKIPHVIRFRSDMNDGQGGYALSKLDWGLIQTPEQLAARDAAKAEKREQSKTKAANSRQAVKDKVEHFDLLKAELEKYKIKAAKLEADIAELKGGYMHCLDENRELKTQLEALTKPKKSKAA